MKYIWYVRDVMSITYSDRDIILQMYSESMKYGSIKKAFTLTYSVTQESVLWACLINEWRLS